MLLSKRAINRPAVFKVTEWIRKYVPDTDIQIFVTEIECRDAGCVPLEVLVILIGPTKRWPAKILKPIIEVVEDDIDQLEIPENIEMWEPPILPPPPPPLPSIQDTGITYVKMRSVGGSSSSSSFTPELPATPVTPKEEGTLGQPQAKASSTSGQTGNRSGVVQEEMDMMQKARHDKTTRLRGCPCCDPDNMENIIDKILFMNTPP